MSQPNYTAACLCGSVRIAAHGEPKRVGLCHCLDCQKTTGAPFSGCVIFDRDHVRISGETGVAPSGGRHFCRRCGSFIFGEEPGGPEIELTLGTIDQRDRLAPTYELWTIRRAPWLLPLPGAAQYERDRVPPTQREET